MKSPTGSPGVASGLSAPVPPVPVLMASTSVDVVLVDTLGELLAFYAAGDVAFVGGSLVPVGGHNLLEPAALGKPTITGPHSFNSPDAARLLERGACIAARDRCHTLADAVQKLAGVIRCPRPH